MCVKQLSNEASDCANIVLVAYHDRDQNSISVWIMVNKFRELLSGTSLHPMGGSPGDVSKEPVT